jgi:uncharacterized protein YndB with AHSA1/START domain
VSADHRARVVLPDDQTILITRELDAPKALVYRAWTEPDLVRLWWHAERGAVTELELDLRVGGAWRYAMITERGVEVAFHGEYLEIVPEERIVRTEIDESRPRERALTTLTLEEIGGRTLLELLVRYGDRRARDAHLDAGMEDGLQDALELAEAVARALAAAPR